MLAEGDQVYAGQNHKPKVTISVAAFVPKAHTPFQWVAQDRPDLINEKQKLIKQKIRSRRITFNYHDGQLGTLEGLFARGDRKVGQVLLKAFAAGCRLDSWRQFFDYQVWLKAVTDSGLSLDDYNYRERAAEETFPWDHIQTGVRKSFLYDEYLKAQQGILTGDCRFTACSVCGICQDLPVKIDYKGAAQVESTS